MSSTLNSSISLRKQRKNSNHSPIYSYLARKKRSYEEETYEILTDNYRKNKRFITEIMVQQFSLLTVSKTDKIRPLHQETNNKMNHGERHIRSRNYSKIKTTTTTLNSPLSQPPIVVSFNNGLEGTELEDQKPSMSKGMVDKEDDVCMSDLPVSPRQTIQSSLEENI